MKSLPGESFFLHVLIYFPLEFEYNKLLWVYPGSYDELWDANKEVYSVMTPTTSNTELSIHLFRYVFKANINVVINLLVKILGKTWRSENLKKSDQIHSLRVGSNEIGDWEVLEDCKALQAYCSIISFAIFAWVNAAVESVLSV